MIQLSSFSFISPEKPAKSSVAVASAGGFAGYLEGELREGELNSGKILPEGGKELPEGLSTEGTPLRPARNSTGLTAMARFKGMADQSVENGTDCIETSDDNEVQVRLDDAKAIVQLDIKQDLVALDAGASSAASHCQQPAPAAAAMVFAGSPYLGQSAQEFGSSGQQRAEKPAAQMAALAKRSAASHGQVLTDDAAQTSLTDGSKTSFAEADSKVKPVETYDSPRVLRTTAAREVRIELAREAKPVGQSDIPGVRSGQITSALALPAELAAQVGIPDNANGVTPAKTAVETLASQPVVRPHEFTALIDRLIEARESARGGSASITVMNSDFGEVTLRFSHENGNLNVSMGNQDPDFVRAVNAVASAEGMQLKDASLQDDRREDITQGASSQKGIDARASSGEAGNGQHGTGKTNRNPQGVSVQQPHFAAEQGEAAMTGIYV